MENAQAPATKIRMVAKKRHYRDHLNPIWEALPDQYKLTGDWVATDLILIAGGPDVRNARHPTEYPYVYVEHGAGQSYIDMPSGQPSSGWSGGDLHERCRLFICPSQQVADRWTERYPETPTAVVGCPRLDRYHSVVVPDRTIAITFHWDCPILPETRSAFDHYRKGLPAIVRAWREQGWTVLGHEHPRWAGKLKRYWASIGVEWTDDPLRDASALAADNTSMMAEMLALSRPVIGLNAPWYRRDVHHGLRFWEWDLPLYDEPNDVAEIVLDDIPDPEWHPYAFADGLASQRAASAIVEILQNQR